MKEDNREAIELKKFGLFRLGVATPELRVGDVLFNQDEICGLLEQAAGHQCQLLLCPELSLTGYTCADLFCQRQLQAAVPRALIAIAEKTAETGVAVVVGAPLGVAGRLFNCAIVLADGCICGVVPKTYLPNSGEFYERRWFSSALENKRSTIPIAGELVPFGTDLLFQVEGMAELLVGIEICEDGWAVQPPSADQALAGATLLLNLSASPEILGKFAYRRELVGSHSGRCLATYAYASAGPNESSTDLVFSGHSLIAENGLILTETKRYSFSSQLAVADVDIAKLVSERQRNSAFAASTSDRVYRIQSFAVTDQTVAGLCRPVPRTPFVPPDDAACAECCSEIFQIQTSGLIKRLRHTGSKTVVIGLSGGLDSTLALLVTAKAFDRLGLDRSGIVSITMPGFGTTGRTRGNAEALAEELGTELRVVPIDVAVHQHFADIGHDPSVQDVTYENSQARERTQILMDVANQVGGLVIGTGDLSELALGWCTYNGDHMSMYAVNSGVPKTLVRYLVSWCAKEEFTGRAAEVLFDICATPVSPELLPPAADGTISQVTEELVGPYELHDFFLYHVVRLHYSPAKVRMLALEAFPELGADEIVKWLKSFYRRFFSQQFKRSCLPDGPKVGSVALSPRGDWRMPSDAAVNLWISEFDV
jgi:NAD+ synthase (glutamine-hydrolysing)